MERKTLWGGSIFIHVLWSCELHLGWFSFEKQPWFKFSRFEACRSVFEFACFETCRCVGNSPPSLTGYQRLPLVHFRYSQSVAQRPTFTRIYSEFNVTNADEWHDLLMWFNLLALSPLRLPVQFIFLFEPEKPSRKFQRLRNKSHKASQTCTNKNHISSQKKCIPTNS